MSDLEEKLKLLGITFGKENLSLSAPSIKKKNLVEILKGDFKENRFGTTFVIESIYPYETNHRLVVKDLNEQLQAISSWFGNPNILNNKPSSFAFLDTETTGLVGGSGIYTFLIGVGKFEEHQFKILQFFLHDPAQESAQLYALEEFLSGCRTVITYNGKSFDIPLLNTRFITHGWNPIFSEFGHIDLLHLVRRLWRDKLPSRTLGNIETKVLHTFRTNEDIPGWLIPQIYFDYLQIGDTSRLANIQYHNLMDVLSLALLFNHLIQLTANPSATIESGEDLLSLAKFYEEAGNFENAINLYQKCLEDQLQPNQRSKAFERLALIYKRQNKILEAIPLWEAAICQDNLNAMIELAKYYEHRAHQIDKALQLTDNAIASLEKNDLSLFERKKLVSELEHRRNRLVRLSKK